MNGVLVINKPTGWTSHDVVAKVRRLLGTKKAGHTGTLDPLATGVLVVCLGKATRIARYLESDEKHYDAEIRLGTITDTLDIDGQVLATRSYVPPSEQDVRTALYAFRGEILQRPPAYSAIKVHGIASHRLARSGQAQVLPERPITIHSIELLEYRDPFVRFTVQCSKGTYVRSLGSDIGNRLGCGACLTALIRTRSGRFSLDQALTIEQLADRVVANDVDPALTPLSDVLPGFPPLVLDEQQFRLISHGNAITCPDSLAAMGEADRLRLVDAGNRLIAVGRAVTGRIVPEVVLV